MPSFPQRSRPHIPSLGLVALSLIAPSAWAQTLDLDSYLSQVEGRNANITASKNSMEAARLKADEGSLAFAPNIFATQTHSSDKIDTGSPFTRTKETLADITTMGVKEMLPTGTSAQVSYTVGSYKLDGANRMMMPINEYATTKTTFEIRQSLWKNFWAYELKAARDIVEAKSDVSFYSERYKMRAALLEAEMAYWKLSFAREVVRISNDNLARAKKLEAWSASRVARGLADKADLMQSESVSALRALDLQSARDDERVAARTLNALRGNDSDTVPETLAEYRVELASRMSPPVKAPLRDDAEAARAGAAMAEAAAEAAEQKYKPSLDVFGTYTLNAREQERSDAIDNSLMNDHPTMAYGLSFSMPIGPSIIGRANEGARLEALAARQLAERKAFDQDQEWRALSAKLSDAKRRLKLATDVETLQKTKLENERGRHLRGRSTLYQVLMFEGEYEASRLGKLGRLTEVLGIAAQMKLFAPRAN